MRVAVVGGGPSGSNAAFFLAQAGIETYLLEKKLQGEKPCVFSIADFRLPLSLTPHASPPRASRPHPLTKWQAIGTLLPKWQK